MGIVQTNENCIGCNRCIRTCSCVGANVAVERDRGNVIEVDQKKCIACGACIDTCEHNAREYIDDVEAFFADLKRGEKISVLIAPAFLANYPREYENYLGMLKALGVNRFISVSFGADITTWGYIKYITEHKYYGSISQPCPAVVGYIERYLPEILPKLMPVQSPMMCAAIYVKKYLGVHDKLAFISPCIAKKNEIDDPNNQKIASYNLTFAKLVAYLKAHPVSGAKPYKDEIEYGLGSIYPMPGGLKENVYWLLGEDALVRQMEGEHHMYEYLQRNADRIKGGQTSYLFVDALNCTNGCLYGTGTENRKTLNEDVFMAIQRIKRDSKNNSRKNENFENLTDSIAQIEKASADNAEQTNGISKSMAEVDAFAKNLAEVLASIEAARAGEAGKGFAVVANEIKTLADNSKTTADDSNKNNNDIRETISKLVQESGRLSQIVDSVNSRAQSLVASSEETAASISMMQSLTKSVEESLKQVLES
ncbi:MAG: 4Fe-4S binding protein [Lachnospiraceae bacterium]|nr:4Fe-4S binding protein [Lachnospiraceae bacterium]